MTINVIVPELGESVVEATIASWLVAVGEAVKEGDALVELETDKVSVEVPAPADGALLEITAQEGDDVNIGDVIGIMDGQANGTAASPSTQPATAPSESKTIGETAPAAISGDATPVARRMAAAEGVDLTSVTGTGTSGRITKQDVSNHLQQPDPAGPIGVPTAPITQPVVPAPLTTADPQPRIKLFEEDRSEERQKMSRRRRTIAKRLVEAQQTAAMLTTFNEIDMFNVIDLRSRRKEQFEESTGVRLGFMSFFVKASVAALKKFPRLNAEIDGDEIVLKHYYDIGIAVGAEEGLVVPVVRDTDKLSFAQIESKIRGFGKQAREGTLTLEDLVGGTFTITNGGIFGSMLSTPILNAPQVGILGMHNIVERPVVVDGEIIARPIMYVALSYDHRIVDGAEAVRFLYTIKELIEDPERLLLEG
ncbi:MAG: 2-oxoglutarate dehydrogenase complex dihydrolipoyllysine-residue succinyltransferase [Ardenticatenaceae bacterium]|nr:2-oxoglutarate dehydrogenase complex dihydrolipoyllysine-residue succinyltransferase [Ardenticatenaceae bacterium]